MQRLDIILNIIFDEPISHFQVILCLFFKTSPRASPREKAFIEKNEFYLHDNGPVGRENFHLNDSFWHSGKRQLGNGLLDLSKLKQAPHMLIQWKI